MRAALFLKIIRYTTARYECAGACSVRECVHRRGGLHLRIPILVCIIHTNRFKYPLRHKPPSVDLPRCDTRLPPTVYYHLSLSIFFFSFLYSSPKPPLSPADIVVTCKHCLELTRSIYNSGLGIRIIYML